MRVSRHRIRSFIQLSLGLAVSCLLWLAPQAGAAVGPNGWGLGDNDDDASTSMGHHFNELAPSSFRFIVEWERLDDPAYRAQAQKRIELANAAAEDPGLGMEIVVTFSVPRSQPTADEWIAPVSRFVDSFTGDVEWWGPANEPNLQGWSNTAAGAALVAEYSRRLSDYVRSDAAAPRYSDGLMSPDFHDHYADDGTIPKPGGISTVERYTGWFRSAGGTFGDVIAWHPYSSVKHRNLQSTDDLVAALDAHADTRNMTIWATEVGALRRLDPQAWTAEEQDAGVRFMTDTMTGLASHPRIERINLYHMRASGWYTVTEPDGTQKPWRNSWDSALLRAGVDDQGRPIRRRAWYTWLCASNPAHPHCSSSTWQVTNTHDSGPAAASFAFGHSADQPVVGDWDGDGTDTPGVFAGGASWRLSNDLAGSVATEFSYGNPSGDRAVAGDWNADGTDSPGVVRTDGGVFHWFLRDSSSAGNSDVEFAYGSTGPAYFLPGDFSSGSGSGDTPGIARPDFSWRWAFDWHLRASNTTGVSDFDYTYGQPGDIPLIGDWDGNGTETPGAYRPSTSFFYLRNSNSCCDPDYAFKFGNAGDTPVVGDWNGDGRDTVGTVRPR